MTDTEELIVAAMDLQADRRPDGLAVRAALARTRARRRGRRTAVIALAAAAVVAIAITAPLVLHRAPSTATPAAVPPNQPAFWQQAMAYEPGWLPDDVVETKRAATPKSILRSWAMPAGSQWPGPTVSIWVANTDDPVARTDATTVVDINGKPAYVESSDVLSGHRTDLTWSPRPHVQVRITVEGGTQHQDIALHIARALRSDGTEQFRPVVDPGWCPYGTFDAMTSGPSAGGHGPQGFASCTQLVPDVAEVQIFVDEDPGLTSGETVRVRGTHGRYASSTKEGTQTLSVPLGDTRYMVVRWSGGNHRGVAPLTKADMIRIADTAVVHDAAYVNWIGTR